MMPVNEGRNYKLQQFFKDYNNCLHDQVCMLAQNTQAASSSIGIPRRGAKEQLMMPNEGDQIETDKSEVAQQPTYDTSYPSGFTVRWNQNGKPVLATVIGSADNSEDDQCKIRLLNSTIKHAVPISTSSSLTTADPADIPQHSADIDPNALESMISKEDLELL
eukprot:15324200-Ditylum_brightwellii.AAC.1